LNPFLTAHASLDSANIDKALPTSTIMILPTNRTALAVALVITTLVVPICFRNSRGKRVRTSSSSSTLSGQPLHSAPLKIYKEFVFPVLSISFPSLDSVETVQQLTEQLSLEVPKKKILWATHPDHTARRAREFLQKWPSGDVQHVTDASKLLRFLTDTNTNCFTEEYWEIVNRLESTLRHTKGTMEPIQTMFKKTPPDLSEGKVMNILTRETLLIGPFCDKINHRKIVAEQERKDREDDEEWRMLVDKFDATIEYVKQRQEERSSPDYMINLMYGGYIERILQSKGLQAGRCIMESEEATQREFPNLDDIA